MPGQMYFGNKERMTWVKCPDSGMGMGGSRYTAEGTFLNGGSFVRNSATGHRSYDLSWNFLRADQKDEIRAYLDSVYGTGLLYFLDPFALRRNILPTCWASPGVAVDGGPRLLGGMADVPTSVQLTVPAGAPTQGAMYTTAADSEFRTLWVPIPPGHSLHMSALYDATGTAALTATPDGGAPVTLPSTGAATALSGTGVTLSLAGVGTISLGYMMAQVLPTGQSPDFSRFYSGVGHSGTRLSGDISDVGYSSPQALDFSALSFTLKETGSWE